MKQSRRLFWSFGLTPVQSWIAEARRSRDLLAGSRILAWLMGDLLGRLDEAGAEILLPRVQPELLAPLRGSLADAVAGGGATVSNRASGWLPISPGGGETVFAQLEDRLSERWGELVGEVRRSAARSAPGLWRTVADAVGEPAGRST
jgi:hypothetical protein